MSIGATAGALVQSAIPSGLGTRDLFPSYGLAFRFTVQVDGLSLGAWQSCGGLKVDFKPTEAKAGGKYDGQHWLPGEATWNRLVLKRAVSSRESQLLQDWLNSKAHAWIAGGSDEPAGDGGTIVLYDAKATPVMYWQLRGVRPAAWSGPDLDASNSRVAIETLELVHEGFTAGTGAPPQGAPPSAAESRSHLVVWEGEGTAPTTSSATAIVFKFPPAQIELKKTQRPLGFNAGPAKATSGDNAEGSAAPLELNTVTPNVATYAMKNLILLGPDVQSDVAKLQRWATSTPAAAAKGGTGGTTKAASKREVLPPLSFSWGSGFEAVRVQLAMLHVSYTRFASDGTPVRATVSLDLEGRRSWQKAAAPKAASKSSSPKIGQHRAAGPAQGAGGGAATAPSPSAPQTPSSAKPGAMNPSSGGVPGHSSVVVAAYDSLPALALSSYGDAQLWRDIAVANDLDDPLRLPPGTALFLPAATEVGL